VSDYRKLDVWIKAHAMARMANEAARTIRSSRYRSLQSQLIRAANSVPANIVEGSGQESAKEFRRFLRYSINSANEAEYHCFAAYDFGLMPEKNFKELSSLIEEVRKMLSGLIQFLDGKD
jgi:four helix bundle protein